MLVQFQLSQDIINRINAIMSNYYPDKSKWQQPNIYPLYEKTFIDTTTEILNGAKSNGSFDQSVPAPHKINIDENTVWLKLYVHRMQDVYNYANEWQLKPLNILYKPTIKILIQKIQLFEYLMEYHNTRYSKKVQSNFQLKFTSAYQKLKQQEQQIFPEDELIYKTFEQGIVTGKLTSLSPTKVAQFVQPMIKNYVNSILE